MELVFVGGQETMKLVIDRKEKILFLASSKTNLELKKVKWKMLFDQGRETLQDMQTEKLSDEHFIAAIQIEMAKVGYRLVSNK